MNSIYPLLLPWLNDPNLDLASIFADVHPSLIEQIDSDMVRFYSDGDVVIQYGDAPNGFVVLLKGSVRIERGGVFMTERQAPSVIGEQAYIDAVAHSADVIAQGLVKALVLPDTLVEHMLDDAAFARNMLRLLSGKLRAATADRAERYRVQELLFDEFRAHLSPTVLNRLLEQGERYGDPRRIDAIVLFSDIRDFTPRSATLPPEKLAVELAPYFEAVVDIIHAHGGMVDKFIGDAVMAIWGYAPTVHGVADSVTAKNVVRCAREMVRVVATLPLGDRPIEIGVGLGYGSVFSGNIGGRGKRQWTVLGETVNMAARYESKSKELAAPIIAGQTFIDLLGDAPSVTTNSSANAEETVPPMRFIAHYDQQMKGAPNQTLYALDTLTHITTQTP